MVAWICEVLYLIEMFEAFPCFLCENGEFDVYWRTVLVSMFVSE